MANARSYDYIIIGAGSAGCCLAYRLTEDTDVRVLVGKGQIYIGIIAHDSDPSKIVDLPNAYAYARENRFPIPEGLIAHRPAASSRDALKVGSFSYIANSPQGRDPQLEKAVEIVLEALQKNPLPKPKRPEYPNYHPKQP